MSYCINARCQERQNPDELESCQACGSSLLINERYRLIRPLRQLDGQHPSEIFEVDNLGTLKVLKVLVSNRRRLVELFQREAEVLQQLKHLGIPRVEAHFVFLPSNGKELHCLVMEKIEGQNLAQWLEENGPISELLARDWLQQLANTLGQVHREQLLHRDIKPSNIMRRPNGHLVLIDFGTVREVTPTYVEKLAGYDVTRVYSPGYTAPEQVSGQAVAGSDFFALGRTFVYLLTDTDPDDLPTDPQTNQLIWRDKAPQTSALFADLIDDLMRLSPQDRPQPQAILEQLREDRVSNEIRVPAIDQPPLDPPQTPQKQHPRIRVRQMLPGLLTVFLTGVTVTSLVMGVRQLGVLQGVELQAFDQLLRLRPAEGPDPRLLIVTVTEKDVQNQNPQERRSASLSDRSLATLLQKLQPFQPQVVGLDVYRDFPVDPKQAGLKTHLQHNDRFIATCEVGGGDEYPGIKPPPEVPQERISFSDFPIDPDHVVRRQLLGMSKDDRSSCITDVSFSFRVAQTYLATKGIQPERTPQGDLRLGSTVFQKLEPRAGGYQRIDTLGRQVLLNYRSSTSIAKQVTLSSILSDSLRAELPHLVKDRIVLIGTTAKSFKDYFATPYSSGPWPQEMPGILIQAHMVSQILSAVLDQRPLLWWFPPWGETLWVWGWSVVGGALVGYFRSPLRLGLVGGAALVTLYGLCFVFLLKGGWVPLVPSVLALVVTGASVMAYRVLQTRVKRL